MIFAAWYLSGLFCCWLFRESLRSGFRANRLVFDSANLKTVLGFAFFSVAGPILLIPVAVGWLCALMEWAPWHGTAWYKKAKDIMNRPILRGP